VLTIDGRIGAALANQLVDLVQAPQAIILKKEESQRSSGKATD
jgi:hypothetical protein